MTKEQWVLVTLDYSKMPPGTKIDGGEIKECPYCHHFGKYKVIQDGFIWVLHSLTWAEPMIAADISKLPRISGADECPKDGIPMLKVSPEE